MGIAIAGVREVGAPYVDIKDEAAVSTEALSLLGMVLDHDEVFESLSAEYDSLFEDAGNEGMTGELLPAIPYSAMKTHQVIAGVARAMRIRPYIDDEMSESVELQPYRNHSPIYQERHFASGTPRQVQARLALHNAETPNNPLVWFDATPFNRRAIHPKDKNRTTQMEAVHEWQQGLGAGEIPLRGIPLGARDMAILALQRHIRGERPSLALSGIRDANFPAVTNRHPVFHHGLRWDVPEFKMDCDSVNGWSITLTHRSAGAYTENNGGVGLAVTHR